MSAQTQKSPRRSEEHTSEFQSRENLVCRLLLEKKKQGDVTGAGVPDFLTVPGPGAAAEVKAFDGVSGGVVRDFYAFNGGLTSSFFIATVVLNEEGFTDFVLTTDAR